MRNHWKKLGLLYCPSEEGRHPKLASHAANPLPILIKGDIYRIFFSGRDVNNRSSIGAVDIDIVKQKIINEYTQPFFEHGPEGSFYADGVSIANCYETKGLRYMLFMGWQSPPNGHWRGDVGQLLVEPDLSLKLACSEPLMGRDATDLISLSYPWVLQTGPGDYRMWYGSTKTWDAGNDEMLHVINHASSFDGQTWNRTGQAVPHELGKAQAFSRPTVIGNLNDGFKMWFSYRGGHGDTYRIGYASSKNGQDWTLALKDAGIGVSADGWDSEMIEYPFAFSHNDNYYLLYNGNGYGKTGFGLAILNNDEAA